MYLFRDRYFETHSIDEAIKKNTDVEKEMKDTLGKFDECKGYEIDGSRAKYYYLKGRALNVVDRFIPQAEELLSKAVKLEPKLIEAWNELGECYWKNDDIKQAKNCFVGALQHVHLFPILLNAALIGLKINNKTMNYIACILYIYFIFFHRIGIKRLCEICRWCLGRSKLRPLKSE